MPSDSARDPGWRVRGVRTTAEALELLYDAAKRRPEGVDYAFSHRRTPFFERLEQRGLAYFTRTKNVGGEHGYWRITPLGSQKWEDMSS